MEITNKEVERLSKIQCLYIDDNLDSQVLFKVQLQKLFKDIKFAKTFAEAVPFLNSNSFDLVVVNIIILEKNDIFAWMIRNYPLNSQSIIVAVSEYFIPKDPEDITKYGFDGFLSKPLFKNKVINSYLSLIKKESVESKINLSASSCLYNEQVTDEIKPKDIPDMSCLYIDSFIDSQVFFKQQVKIKKIFFAQNFDEAVPLLRTEKLDFVVVDLWSVSPDIDVIGIIKGIEKNASIPIIAVSVPASAYQKQSGDNALVCYQDQIIKDFDSYIPKPLYSYKIMEALKKVFFEK